MFDIIIMDNNTIHCHNYCLCCYSKFICYYLFIKCFGFHMPWQLPFPIPPPPLSTINCTTRTFKNICIYLYHICGNMPYSRISQIKKVFNLANAI